MRRILAALLCLALGSCDSMGNLFRKGSVAEPPPPEYDSGPFVRSKVIERHFDSLDELQAYCARFNRPADRGGYVNGCYAEEWDGPDQIIRGVVALPSAKAWPNPKEIPEIARHEYGHARGGKHDRQGRWKRNLFAESPEPQPPQGNPFRGR